MTNQLLELIERVKTWPAERQQDVARMLEAMEASGTETYRLSDEERRLVDEGLASPVVSDADMKKFWNRHRV
jgi:hypothetical protein